MTVGDSAVARLLDSGVPLSGILLPYQARWVADRAGLKAIEKSRRIGISWAEAYDAVLHAASGAGDVYYQSYAMDMTRGWIGDCAAWADALDDIVAGAVGETLVADADGDRRPAFRLPLAGGRQIVALTSSPRQFRSRGRPGDRAVIDEAAWIDDLDEVLAAALAFRTWGGQVRIISTHHGEGSPFAALCRDVADGAVPGSLHTVTLADALRDGLYRRIAAVSGETWTPAAEAAWEAGLRAEYGHRAAEELDCVPLAGAGAWLAWDAIRACEHPDAGRPDLYAGGPVYVGIDQAIRHHLWVAVVLEIVGDVAWTREIVAIRGGSFADRDDAVGEIAARYRPVRIAADQTGLGERPVEDWRRRHGAHRVEGVIFSAPRRLDLATALRERVEDRRLRIPADPEVRLDLHSVRAEAGPTGAPRLRADDSGDSHADRFWAAALACAAAATPRQAPAYTPVRPGPRRSREDGWSRPDHSGDPRRPAAAWAGYAPGRAADLRAR